MKAGAKIAWIVLALLALENSLGAFRYLLPTVPFPAPLPNFLNHRYLLALHAFGGGVALLVGPLQLLPPFRNRHWKFHRWTGWIYCGAVLVGGLAAMRLAEHAQTGRVASAGFFVLAVAWLVATGLALNFIVRGNVARHRRWMIRSYALTAAATTLRIYLPLSIVWRVDFSLAYPAIAWLCWVPNALFAEIYLWSAVEPAKAAPRTAVSL